MYTHKTKFGAVALYQVPSESMKGFLSKRWSFWLALFSCIAFLVGNMVGQHGWKAFWKSVWGKEAVIEMQFSGTTSPIAAVPDPLRWSPISNHHFDYEDVPEELLIPLPAYTPHGCSPQEEVEADRSIYSVEYDGDYESGGEGCGSHPAVDILVPKGTPVLSMANGVVERVEERTWGFGNTIVIRHPNVPDPNQPKKLTTLHSSYAHLGRILVHEGDIVHVGDQIAVSGQTGLATAPHLHFQIDRDNAPFKPYWPFTTEEATNAGLSFMDAVNSGLGQSRAREYTVNPMQYVQAYVHWQSPQIADADSNRGTTLAGSQSTSAASEAANSVAKELNAQNALEVMRSRAEERRQERLVYLDEREERVAQIALRSTATEAMAVHEGEMTTAEQNIPMPKSGPIATLSILHDGNFADDEWEEIRIFARDGDGNFVHHVHFGGKIYLESGFGEAEFSPSVLTEEQFDEGGKAVVRMYPRSHKTIVPIARGVISAEGQPMVYENGHTLSVQAESPQGG